MSPRHLTCLLSLALATALHAQRHPFPKERPRTVEEALAQLDVIFGDTTRYTFRRLPEGVATVPYHFSFGMQIRNVWGLWKGRALARELQAIGFRHPDDMSAALLLAYHRRLNGRPLGLEEEAVRAAAYWAQSEAERRPLLSDSVRRQRAADEAAALALFPVGDTIIVKVYARYRKHFTTYASGLRGRAVVLDRTGDKLVVQLLSLTPRRRDTPERRVGEVFEVGWASCELIPRF